MQATATTPPVPDSPSFGDSSKKKTSSNSSKRAKASVACQECRKRKVKCEGIHPCSRCLKSNFKCIFPQQQSKNRGPPKQYIEILEARLQIMEKALRMIGGPAKDILDDALSLDPHALQDKNGIYEDDTTTQQANEYRLSSIQQSPDQFAINEIGQPYYTHHILQHSMHLSPYHHQPMPSDGSEIEPTTPMPSNHLRLTDIDTSLVDLYFEHVHPYTPMIKKSAFKLQFTASANNTPTHSFMFLVFTMCAVAARWSPFYLGQSNEPPGFSYYQRAFALFDEANAFPCINTIQALVLLTKYQEQYKRAGYFYRPGYCLSIAIDMCYSLKLPSLVASGDDMNGADLVAYETKKRTFWMTFLYDLWISIEEGRETRFDHTRCSIDYLSSTDGDDENELMTGHNLVIRLARILSDIYRFSRRLGLRQQIQGTVRTSNQQIEEEGRLLVMQTALENYLRDVSSMSPFAFTPSTTEFGKYPVAPGAPLTNVFTGFLHMMYHYSIILLHRHHVLYPISKPNDNECIHPPPFPHQQICATSASIINIIAESIMESTTATLDVFHYPTRGVQFTILCVTMAIAVHKFEMETAQDEHRKSTASTLYWQALSIINRLATETSAVEIAYLAKDAELAEMCGKLAMDSKTTNTNTNASLQSSSTGSSIAYNNDTSSSTSSSPILGYSVLSSSTGSVTDKINRSTKLTKPRRGTVSGPPVRRFTSQMVSSDTATPSVTAIPTSPTSTSSTSSSSPPPTSSASLPSGQQHSPHGVSSTINPAVLFNSSASITNPARLASLIQLGSIPTTSYNHHQQPIQAPTTLNSASLPQSSQRQMQRSLHHYSQSQEDLRSLNQQHFNNRAGYTRTADPGGLPQGRLKKHRSMKFLPMHTQQLQHTVQQYPPPAFQIQQPPLSQQVMYQQLSHQHIPDRQPPMHVSHQNHHHHMITNSPSSQQQHTNFPMIPTTASGGPINRRHTISFTGMDTSSFISPPTTTPLDYASIPPNSSMMQMDNNFINTNAFDLHQYRQPPPAISAIYSTQSTYAPMMVEDDSQMMMMDPGTATVGFTDLGTFSS